MAGERFIGIDIGGTQTRIVYSPSLEPPLLEGKTIFPTTNNFEQDYQRITQYVDTKAPINGVGISIPGNLSEDKSTVVYAVHVPGYMDKPLSRLLHEQYQCDVRMDNDAAVVALGEALYGTTEKNDFAYIIWGTGVGGASVVYQGGIATSTPLDWEKYLQTWDETCGGNSVKKIYGKPAEQLNYEEWENVMSGFSKEMLSFIDKTKPKRIIFGGGIAMKQAIRLHQLTTQLQHDMPQVPTIEISKLGEDAGLYGALGLLK